MDILYHDNDIVVCIKPARVLSTDEPGGLPECLRQHFGLPHGDFRTVHRLDRVVSGVMVVARNARSASELSRQIRMDEFGKEYLAVVHGVPTEPSATLYDLLGRDKARKMTFVASEPAKGVQEASLDYELIETVNDMSLIRVKLHTGRTHQIRVQFASRGMPIAGERKYAVLDDPWEIALWSNQIRFRHPVTGEMMTFEQAPPAAAPWDVYQIISQE